MAAKSEHKISLKTTLRKFGETTSIKGIGRLIKSGSIFVRVMWLFAVIIGMTVATYQTTLLLNGYFSYKMTTESREIYANPQFPDITLCNLNPLSVSKVSGMDMQDYFDEIDRVLRSEELRSMLKYPESKVNKLVLPQIISSSGFFQNVNFMNQSVGSLDKFVLSCKVYNWQWKEISTNDSEACMSIISMYFSPDYYMCFRLQISVRDQSRVRGMALVLYLNDVSKYSFKYINTDLLHTSASGVRVNIHPRDTLPDSKDGVNVPPGQETNIMIHAKYRTKLKSPYSTCQDTDILNKSRGQYKYTVSACDDLCYQDMIIKRCGCTAAHILSLPDQHSRLQFCGKLDKLINLGYNLTEQQLEDYFTDEEEYYEFYEDPMPNSDAAADGGSNTKWGRRCS